MRHPCQPMVALIPARAGSKRVPGKNTRLLNGHPLIAYTIAAAQQSGVFSKVCVSSEEEWILQLSVIRYGADHGIWRPADLARDDSADIGWIRHGLSRGALVEHGTRSFAILRPTSPFRTADTIRRAYRQFTLPDQTADSIRAVEPVKQSPYKMWTQAGDCMPIKPLLEGKHPDGTPYHSSPTQSLPLVYVQNSSLEMAWTSNVEAHGTISGRKVAPFFTRDLEGFAIDTEADWREAEYLARTHPDALPPVAVARVPAAAEAQ